jgi:predicted transcriptional regulator
MEAVWRRQTATVQEVLDDLNAARAARRERALAYTTVMTLLGRLCGRGLLKRERDGRSYRYSPSTTRDELVVQLADEAIARLLADFGDVAVTRFDAQIRERPV